MSSLRIYTIPLPCSHQTVRSPDLHSTYDKEQYKPGENVTVTVKTTNNGKPIKSTVNVSVINKAVFEITQDRTDILNSIYQDKFYNVYT